MKPVKTYEKLASENSELRLQLDEALDAINAIRTGKIDALIVQGDKGQELYTLKSADQSYRIFIEKMNQGAVTLQLNGTILYANSRFASMVATPLEKVIGSELIEFISAESVSLYSNILEPKWNQDLKTEIQLKGESGKSVPCLISCNRLQLEESESLSLIVTDLTTLKKAEDDLLKKNQELEQAELATRILNDSLEELVQDRTRELFLSREQFKFLADQIPVLVWTANPKGEIDYLNDRWYEYSGPALGESNGRIWEKSVHTDDLHLTRVLWAQAVESGEPFEIEYRLKRAFDGLYRWHLVNALPFKDENGKIIAWFGTGTDIEEQKQAIEKRDEFIGIASHELKTPLTTVKAYLEIISTFKKEPLPTSVTEYVSKAQGAMRKLQNLVNDLLDVSKIHAGQLLYDKKDFDLSELVKSCIENFSHLYPERQLNCNCSDYLKINGNAGRIEQVIMNLISNAVKYSPPETDIEIIAKREGDDAVISLVDQGIGLSPEQKSRVFERFYRVEDKKYLTSGLGMGLYISSEIIKAHGGMLKVSSEIGKGSTFSLVLPLVQIAVDV